jgi:hypothetical protein
MWNQTITKKKLEPTWDKIWSKGATEKGGNPKDNRIPLATVLVWTHPVWATTLPECTHTQPRDPTQELCLLSFVIELHHNMNTVFIRLKESIHTKQQRQKAIQFLIPSLICTFLSDSTSTQILSVAHQIYQCCGTTWASSKQKSSPSWSSIAAEEKNRN